MIWLAIVLGSVAAGWLLGHGDAADNARAASDAAAVHLLTAFLGVTVGLYGRDRIRLRRTYASPTLAYTGKFLFFASLAPATALVLSPIAWPLSSLHFSSAGCALGVALWLGNLPLKV